MREQSRHILILRLSALGDVLMTLPVVDSIARQHPDVRFTMVSRAFVRPLVDMMPGNVHLVVADVKGRHKGFNGLNRLCRRLLALHPTDVADLHDVLRTKWLRLRLSMHGTRVEHVNKDRRARREFIRAEVKTQQTPMFERYADVFRRLGLDIELDFTTLQHTAQQYRRTYVEEPPYKPALPAVAIAPFAAHAGKTYPAEMMEQVVQQLSARGDIEMLLFGAGAKEREVLERWARTYPHVTSMANRLNGLGEELSVIAQCRLMLSMDSANMHLASLAAVPVLSIWGATHPQGGFMGYGQPLSRAIQRDDLKCRPCSTFGQAPCSQGDYPCLLGIAPTTIVKRIEQELESINQSEA